MNEKESLWVIANLLLLLVGLMGAVVMFLLWGSLQ